MKNICVYCGSNNGNSLIYRDKATELARELVKNKILRPKKIGNEVYYLNDDLLRIIEE